MNVAAEAVYMYASPEYSRREQKTFFPPTFSVFIRRESILPCSFSDVFFSAFPFADDDRGHSRRGFFLH